MSAILAIEPWYVSKRLSGMHALQSSIMPALLAVQPCYGYRCLSVCQGCVHVSQYILHVVHVDIGYICSGCGYHHICIVLQWHSYCYRVPPIVTMTLQAKSKGQDLFIAAYGISSRQSDGSDIISQSAPWSLLHVAAKTH